MIRKLKSIIAAVLLPLPLFAVTQNPADSCTVSIVYNDGSIVSKTSSKASGKTSSKTSGKKSETPNEISDISSTSGDDGIIKEVAIEGRIAYEYQAYQNMMLNNKTGFKAQALYLNMSGQFTDNFSYNYRQRLDNVGTVSFFNAMEVLDVKWDATSFFHVSGGKQAVAFGSYEFDTPYADLYYTSEFLYNFRNYGYQYGGSLDVDVTSNDNILVQLLNSPFVAKNVGNIYATAIMWRSKHGFYSSRWSYNLMQMKFYENTPKKYFNYIALGNRFDIIPDLYLTVDFINRSNVNGIPSGLGKIDIAKDYSIIAEASYRPMKPMRTFLKYTRDVNEDNTNDKCMHVDTDIHSMSAGIEYEAAKTKVGCVKAFAVGMYNWGKIQTKDVYHNGEELRIQVGAKATLNILGTLKK